MHHHLLNTTIFAMSWKQRPPKCWVSGCLTFWLADWVTDWSGGWLTDWLADMLTDLLTDLLTNIVVNWLADWLNYWLAVLLINWLTDSRIPIDWSWLLAHWLIELTGWLIYWDSWKEKNQHYLLWIKIKYWLLMKMVNFSFQIRCGQQNNDVLRLQQPGFWAYLQYCKCCIHCFVIYNPRQNCWDNSIYFLTFAPYSRLF